MNSGDVRKPHAPRERQRGTGRLDGEGRGQTMSMATARVTSKGQITVPLEVRRFLSIQKGDRIMFRQDGDRVYVERVPANVPSSEVFGRLHRPAMEPLDIETARVKARAMRAQRLLGSEGDGGR